MAPPALRRFLLDTNIVIALFAQEAGVLQQLQHAAGIVLPCIVLGELYYGARKSGRVAANVRRVDDLAAQKAMQHNLTLVSRDAHFDEIEGLSVVAW